MKNAFLKVSFILGFCLVSCFFVSKVANAAIDCSCSLVDSNSKCSVSSARNTICIKAGFISSLLNDPGANFVLRSTAPGNPIISGDGGNLLELDNNNFIIKGGDNNAQDIYFDEMALIENNSLNINLTASRIISSRGTDIDVNNVLIKAPEIAFNGNWGSGRIYADGNVTLNGETGVTFQDIWVKSPLKTVIITTDDGEVHGGMVSNAATAANPRNGGNITISGKIIEVGNLNAKGYNNGAGADGNGGNIFIHGSAGQLSTILINGSISTSSLSSPSQKVFGTAGQITIGDDTDGDGIGEVEYIEVNGNIYSEGLTPKSVKIKTNSVIWLAGGIFNYSGCDVSTKKEKNDYETLNFGIRKFCPDFKRSGDVILKSSGKGVDSGIWVEGDIDNRSENSHFAFTGDNYDESYAGGIAGKILLEANSGVVALGSTSGWGGGINNSGFHSDSPAVRISGTWVQTGSSNFGVSIITDNVAIPAFPAELTFFTPTSAGDISIEAKPIDNGILSGACGVCKISEQCINSNSGPKCVSKPIVILSNRISAAGNYVFSPDGGDVDITSSYRVEGDMLSQIENMISINTSGNSLNPSRVFSSSFDTWYINDPVYTVRGSGVYIDPTDPNFEFNYCGFTAPNEFLDAVTLTPAYISGQKGGNGGNISINTQILQWFNGTPWSTPSFKVTPNLVLISSGGNGSRGAFGKSGFYCLQPFEITASYKIPKIVYGGKGGNGGTGGAINVSAGNEHCCTEITLRASGGEGGANGNDLGMSNSTPLDQYALTSLNDIWTTSANYHTGTCDVANWKNNASEFQPIASLGVAGNGGSGGAISFAAANSMPSGVKTLNNSTITSDGGKGGSTAFGLIESYPWYCNGVLDNLTRANNIKTLDPTGLRWTPCQTSVFAAGEEKGTVGVGALWGTHIYQVPRTRVNMGDLNTAPYNGSIGASGGAAGNISYLTQVTGVDHIISAKGGNGIEGGPGQNTSYRVAGNGGNGGNAGSGGLVKVGDPTWFQSITNSGGVKGDPGKKGISAAVTIEANPKACGDVFWHHAFMSCDSWPYSCKEVAPDVARGRGYYSVGFEDYGENLYVLKFTPEASDGTNGNNGSSGSVQKVSLSDGTLPCHSPDAYMEGFPVWPISLKQVCYGEHCVNVPGTGEAECFDDSICIQSHRACNGLTCEFVSYDAGADTCFDSSVCTVPVNSAPLANNLLADASLNSCTIGSNPPIIFSWNYIDPDNIPPGTDPQSAFQVQVSTDAGFGSIFYDSGKILSGSNTYTPPLNTFNFDTPYYWRLMVWDSSDQSSPWINGPNISAISEYPKPEFMWDPANPSKHGGNNYSEEIEFLDNGSRCSVAPCQYSWIFPDAARVDINYLPAPTVFGVVTIGGLPNPSPIPNPKYIVFSMSGVTSVGKAVQLCSKDNSGRQCCKTHNVLLGSHVPPYWQEISPKN